MAHLFIFGLGYAAKRIKANAEALGWQVGGTGGDTGTGGGFDFDDKDRVRRELAAASHILSSVPPASASANASDSGADPVLSRYGDALNHGWLGYLSSTGVYGDTKGAWVDESAPLVGLGSTGRRTARAECDAAWLERGARVFRLPGIYGPGRSALNRVAAGKARRIDSHGQVFSRIHVEDIANGVIAAMTGGAPAGAYNLADDLPCSQNQVIEEACRLMGAPPPPLQTLEEADLSPTARAFYAENRRVANGKAKRVLGWQPSFPDYRSGLNELWRDESWRGG